MSPLLALVLTSLLPANGPCPQGPPAEPEAPVQEVSRTPLRSDPARVEVLVGRARAVRSTGITELCAGAAQRLEGDGVHLHVPAGAVVRVAWEGLGSLRIEGPAALEWSREESETIWRLVALGRADGEVRRPGLRLVLPNGWTTRPGEGAWRLAVRPSGVPVVEHRAGAPLRLVWHGDARVRPPVDLVAGERRTLPVPDDRALPEDRTLGAPSWPEAAWPWSGPAPPGPAAWAPQLAAEPWPWHRPTSPSVLPSARDPAARAPGPTVDQRTAASEPGAEAPSEAALPDAADPGPDRERDGFVLLRRAPGGGSQEQEQEPGQGPSAGTPALEPGAPTEPAPARITPDASARGAARGLGAEDLVARGQLWVQRTPGGRGFRVLELPGSGGGYTVTLDRRRSGAAWCFTPLHDLEVQPGGQVVLDGRGAILSHSGGVRVLAPQASGR